MVTVDRNIQIARELILDVHRDIGGITHTTTANTSNAFIRVAVNQAVSQVVGAIAQDVQVFARALAEKTALNRDTRVTTIHRIAGERAQQATVAAYQLSQTRNRKGQFRSAVTSINRPNRFANGVMLRALQNPAMITANFGGVSFINRSFLDRTAKQWYRLNFGAGIRGGSTPRGGDHAIQFFGAVAADLSISEFGPSAAFFLPRGVFLNDQGGAPDPSRRGKDEFLPASFAARRGLGLPLYKSRLTRGIRGSNFFDAGVQALAFEFGRGWTVLLAEWLEESSRKDTGPISQFLTPVESAEALGNIRASDSRLDRAFIDFNSRYAPL